MKINTKATNLRLRPETANYLNKKLEQLSKYVETKALAAAIAIVELAREAGHKQGDVFRADIDLEVWGKHFYTAATAGDLYSAIDQLKDGIISEVRSYRDRRVTLVRRGGRLFKAIARGGWRWRPWRRLPRPWRYFRRGRKSE